VRRIKKERRLKLLELLDHVGAHGLRGGLGLEDTGLASEGVDALALLGGGALLDDEAGHARDHELAALGELAGANLGEGVEADAGFLLGETGLNAEVVEELRLVQVGALGGDKLEVGLRLGDLEGLLRGGLLLGGLRGLGCLLDGLLDDLLALGSDLLAALLLAGSHGEK